jgi:cob(I)alamin adenosyltransferase
MVADSVESLVVWWGNNLVFLRVEHSVFWMVHHLVEPMVEPMGKRKVERTAVNSVEKSVDHLDFLTVGKKVSRWAERKVDTMVVKTVEQLVESSAVAWVDWMV